MPKSNRKHPLEEKDIERFLSSPSVNKIFSPEYEEVPVSITRFLTDEYYLGNVGKQLYPIWKRNLIDLFKPGNKVIEVVFSGATRTGKSTVANVIQLYNLYKLLCLRSPSEYYGLIASEPIAIALFNITEELAYEVTFKKFKGYMEMSPWFMERVSFNRTGSSIVLPKNIRILLGSRSTHALGNAVIGGVMDEVDFSKTQSTAYKMIYDTYINIRRRMEGQFMKYLKKDPPGTLCLISSVTNDVNSFLESRIKQSLIHDNIRVFSYAQWEVKEQDYTSTERFQVYIGDNKHPAKILTQGEDITNLDPSKILNVPIDYKQIFEEDLERALMDVGGVRPGYGTRRFIPSTDELYNTKRTKISSVDIIEIGLRSSAKIQDYITVEKLPEMYSNLPRFIHVDLSKNKDKTGIASVTITGIDPKNSTVNFYVDFVIAVKSLVGDEIDYDKIRDFIVYLLDGGLRVQGISFDSFQSQDSLQYFQKLGRIPIVKMQSVDRTTEAYYALRSAIINKRIDLYYHTLLNQELLELQENIIDGKIDHPPGGSKDMADALAGAIQLCIENQSYFTTFNKTSDFERISIPNKEQLTTINLNNTNNDFNLGL